MDIPCWCIRAGAGPANVTPVATAASQQRPKRISMIASSCADCGSFSSGGRCALTACSVEEETGERIPLEPSADTSFHPLAKFRLVADEVGKVGAVPGWNVAFQRSWIRACKTSARTVTPDISEGCDSLPATEHGRVLGLRQAVHTRPMIPFFILVLL